MISWMQKHNKYLVWTIWIATVAFIGAGFVGWGSLKFGAKATSIAKVGEIEISQHKLNQAYSNLYNRYSQLFQGNFDEAKAKELGLVQQAFSSVKIQAEILNFAKDNGIVVTDEEVAKEIQSIKIFQVNGVFDQKAYKTYLQTQRLKAKDFEATLKEDMTIQKTLSLLHVKPLDLEIETIASAMAIKDKVAYKVLSDDDINVSVSEKELKDYWSEHRLNYMSEKSYKLAIIWEVPTDINATQSEIEAYYKENSFDFTNSSGKLLTLDEAKPEIEKALALKKIKKDAQLAYIALKKHKIAEPKAETLSLNDNKLSSKIWNEIELKSKSDILKPKVVDGKYAIIKIVDIIEPKEKTFDEAKSEVEKEFKSVKKADLLEEEAKNIVEKLQKEEHKVTDFITIDSVDKIEGLNTQESLQFLQNLFSSNKEKGSITINSSKIVVYNILEQKIDSLDSNKTEMIIPTISKIKSDIFESNLIKQLNQKYKTELYVKGLTK